ncbi:heme-degrading monooxygenase HmoA [Pullulanibacillus pueri]|uniref:Antibiotic biosynthesis monooxygenase n=1 Tax=Pullulanibacillus pueri TaxID=1437324 RepID=A0A8J2ZZR4_9BACL|nr:antibiotic biosynthesis monooxygenase [Pullulanibacillus pueri]MBM7683768.1 heme-degrading monooxygenase HmoA [Pullulanibacillus pueri]GGH87299.1 antibiotic biosynthesis monooxygenase [Pullulanibacillus pueri]
MAYAVIFTSKRTDQDASGYARASDNMMALAKKQPGFIRVESARNPEGDGITVSYWESLEAIKLWRENAKHQAVQRKGKDLWYSEYKVKICKIEREYSF